MTIFFDRSSTAFSISLFLCAEVDFGCSSFVGQNWRISVQNGDLVEDLSSWIDESFSPCKMIWFALNSDRLLRLLDTFSVYLCIPVSHPPFHCALWSAFGLPRISLFTLFLYPFCTRHNYRRRSLSMLVPRKKWTVPQLTGVHGIVRVPRDLDCTLVPSRSLLSSSRKDSNSIAVFYLDDKRKAQRWQPNTSCKHRKIYCDEKRMWCRKMLNFCCTTVQFLSIFSDFSSTSFKISLFLSSLVRRLNWVAVNS